MGRVHNETPGVITVEGDGGEIRWSSQFPPVNLLPESDWIEAALTVDFPNFTTFVNYGHSRYYIPPNFEPIEGQWSPSASGDVCTSITMIEPEDRVLGPAVIGSVPAGINFLDVRVQLARTKAPYIYLDQDVPPIIPDEWVTLQGTSCLVEATDIWRRSFDVVLVGTEIHLIRRQSVAKVGSAEYPRANVRSNGASGPDPWSLSTISYWANVNAAGNGYTATQRDGHPAALIQAKDFSANMFMGGDTPTSGGKHLRRFNACSIDNSAHDFSSTYSGQIVVRPGYIAP